MVEKQRRHQNLSLIELGFHGFQPPSEAVVDGLFAVGDKGGFHGRHSMKSACCRELASTEY